MSVICCAVLLRLMVTVPIHGPFDRRPSRCDLDAIGKELHTAITRNVHVTIFAIRTIQPTKAERFPWNWNSNITTVSSFISIFQ